ncbi:MAG: hypothetical protein II949_13530 [Prevotella sp.]|nr:hypothetical protein [Prevotella sp.]
MKKTYQPPTLHIVRLQHQAQLLQGTTTQGKFIDDTPPGGWDEGGANSRRGGWDDEE